MKEDFDNLERNITIGAWFIAGAIATFSLVLLAILL